MATNRIRRTTQEIEDLHARANEAQVKGTKYPGMSYEEGIAATIEWLLDEFSDEGDPLED